MYSDYDQEYGTPYRQTSTYDEFEPHTGDPVLDLEYERQQQMSAGAAKMPEMVEKFLVYLKNVINEGLVDEIQTLYENDFPRLSDQYFDSRPWPDEHDLAGILGPGDDVFLMLYNELYHRHVHARVPNGPTRAQRFHSFINYCNLVNYIVNADNPVPLELPDVWLWELIDEFIYQYQNYTQYRARMNKLDPDELKCLAQEDKVILLSFHSKLKDAS